MYGALGVLAPDTSITLSYSYSTLAKPAASLISADDDFELNSWRIITSQLRTSCRAKRTFLRKYVLENTHSSEEKVLKLSQKQRNCYILECDVTADFHHQAANTRAK